MVIIHKTTEQRVSFAIRHIYSGRPTNRNFDGCFEESDADKVVEAIVKRSIKSPSLAAKLPRYIAASSIEKFSNQEPRTPNQELS